MAEDINSDDYLKDKSYKDECKVKRCLKKSSNLCACGHWLCETHFLSGEVCTVHAVASSDSETVTTKRKRKTSRECENTNCSDEIFSSCHKCSALLCYDHFMEDPLDCLSHTTFENISGENMENFNLQEVCQDVAPRVLTSERNLRIQRKPEDYLVDGSHKESEERHLKKDSYRETKQKKYSGQAYIIPKSMNLVPPKQVGERCNSKYCTLHNKKCGNFTENQRESIMKDFYSLGKLELQREFICRHVVKEESKVKKGGSRRQLTYRYFLTINGILLPVCKNFFLKTLAISEKMMRTSLSKLSLHGTVEKEKRGGRRRCLQERDEAINSDMTAHILRFPKVESHYCREKSSRQYLHSELNLVKMYEMYKQEITEQKKENNIIGSLATYRRIFDSMNLSFHNPKKDLCTLCARVHETADSLIDEILNKEYESHIANKNKVREIKRNLKEMAIKNSKRLCAVFDLQQVIHLPISKESALFYKQRLSVYNFTVYNIANRDCHCYTWHEGQSKRGSSEISTCLYKFLEIYDKDGVKTVDFFSDGCYGQNKNSVTPSMYLYFLSKSKNIEAITHYFFEKNHGQSEGDSAHSAISTSVKKVGDVFIPSQLVPVFRLARKKHPYIVNEMQYKDFWDFKMLSQDLRVLSIKKDDQGGAFKWSEVSQIKVEKQNLEAILFKTNHNQDSFRRISLQRNANASNINLKPLNISELKIPEKKYDSLISLCEGKNPVIRQDVYKILYYNLNH